MKKVFGLFLSLIVLMGLWSCNTYLPLPNDPNSELTGYIAFVPYGVASVALAKVGEPFDISLEYSLDGKSWEPYTIGEVITISEFQREVLQFRAGKNGNAFFSSGNRSYYCFKISGVVDAWGDIMSLLDRSCRKNDVPSYAFFNLFRDCTGLMKAPALPATELAEGCYTQMFEGCTNLTEAPELPATELAEGCYSRMFEGCTSLTEAPALPATKLAEGCYTQMFEGCTSLIGAPALPATELAKRCYARMFYGCTNLRFIKALFTDEPSIKTNEDWLSGVAPAGLFVKSREAKWDVRGSSGIPKGWTVESDTGTSDFTQKPIPGDPSLSFVSTGKSRVSLVKIGNPDPITLEYSVNGSVWKPYTIGGAIALLDGEKLMFRAGETGNKYFSKGYNDYYQFEISGEVAAKGNIMSLLDRKCLRKTVSSCEFYSLFKDCQSLTSTPELPATKLADGCYRSMFKGCKSLDYVKALFTDEPFISATEGWLLGVSFTGTFVKSKDATWDVRGYDGIPYGWTVMIE